MFISRSDKRSESGGAGLALECHAMLQFEFIITTIHYSLLVFIFDYIVFVVTNHKWWNHRPASAECALCPAVA